eukprot:TRINITY_DN6094_c0_g1_i4.p1 TRINITY_DN6094_c0_g1~~TRINITY_DN6094_c0_g1_i4.p1  ORF type:complete len:150 (-),score=6.95 TRINITY_DN6094_c0_g1_i4:555-1004(-)
MAVTSVSVQCEHWWPFTLSYIIPLLLIVAHYIELTTWSVMIFGFIILPVLDHFIGLDETNLSKEKAKELEKELSFRYVTWLWVPTQTVTLAWAADKFVTCSSLWSVSEQIGFLLSCGLVSGKVKVRSKIDFSSKALGIKHQHHRTFGLR